MPPVFRGIKVHLHADRLHVSEQELDTDMEHAKIHVWAAVAARACASMQRARYLWLAPTSQHGLGQLLTPFLPSGSQTVIRDRFLFQFAERV